MTDTKLESDRELAIRAWKRFGLYLTILTVVSVLARVTLIDLVSPTGAIFLGPVLLANAQLNYVGIPVTFILLAGISVFLASPNALTGVAFVVSIGIWLLIGTEAFWVLSV